MEVEWRGIFGNERSARVVFLVLFMDDSLVKLVWKKRRGADGDILLLINRFGYLEQ
jgi:hypothetical protein